MILNKALLLKCLGGVAACTGVAGVGILGSQISTGGTTSGDITPANQDNTKLTEKAGLNCNDSTKECTLKEGSKINVKYENGTKEEGKSFTSGGSESGRIKLQTENDNTADNPKLVIEGGDISLTSENNTSPSITKLEQFETYEIEEVDESGNKKYFLSRKTKASEGIRKELGLPEGCSFPETSSSPTTCDIGSGKINDIKFDGKSSGTASISEASSLSLTVTKLSSSDSDFPFDYKFEFKGSSSDATLTINNNTITLKQNEATEFRIKKGTSGNNITLEEVGTLEELLGKVGLTNCTSTSSTNNECSIGTTGLNVKQESNSQENKKISTSSSSSTGKIKVYKENSSTTYNKGFKFVIEEGDIELTEGSGSGTVSKLEQFETYEIKKEDNGNKWYLTRKTKAAEGIKKALGLPEDCDLSTTSGCVDKEISSENIKNINFDGKTTGQDVTLSGTTKLTVTKEDTTDPDFPYGYKFTFKAESTDATITITSSKTVTVKTNTGTEFRIKKGTSGNNITLEEAWTKERLLEKVGLECNGGTSNDECTQKSGKNINIKQDSENLENKTLESSNQGKIKLYTGDQASGYNHGFKFVIEEKDISITDDSTKKLEQFETYEIKEDGSGSNKKWYFSRKKKASEEIKTALGLPTDNWTLPTAVDSPTTCSDINGDKLKAINFDGKGNDQPSIESNGSATLTITKTSDTTNYPLGYKFVFDPTETVTISATNKIAKSSKTEFKIKKSTSGNTITLEKAWNAKSLGAKVGLECKEASDSEKTCTLKDGSINVKNDDNNKIDGAKEKSGQGSSKKVTYQEDAEGHNQGIKFTVEGNDCISLTKDGDGGATTSLNIENSNTTYEIKEHTENSRTKWYLTKKGNAQQST